jgi:hypothetical protein
VTPNVGLLRLLDSILDDVHRELTGHLQPDDLTLLTASVVG